MRVIFFYLDFLHSFRTKNKLKCGEKVFKSKHFCRIVTLSEKECILECNQYMKSDKMSYILYILVGSLV